MPTLRDRFDRTHKKDIKGKGGVVVRQVDYVEWAQVATRLDEAEDVGSWSFTIIQLGPDWCHGRLTLVSGDSIRTFENVGYAENADADWKKEVLKDATSDALKRCAAMAGVARYLYDDDAPQRPQNGSHAPARAPVAPVATPRPAQPTTPPTVEPDWMNETMLIRKPEAVPTSAEFERQHGVAVAVDNPPMTLPALFEALDAKGIPRQHAVDVSKRMFGQTLLKTLSNAQRGDLWAEVSG